MLENSVIENGRLQLGGADVGALAREYGTPLYLLDEDEVARACRAFTGAMGRHYGGDHMVAYASKALSFTGLYRLMAAEGMGVDVVSGGELYTAQKAGFPMERVIFHGNNKTAAELVYALNAGVGRIVLDNLDELRLLDETAGRLGKTADISFRIKPGIDAHTHDFVQTGKIDSKFGVALENGEALEAYRQAAKRPHLRPVGVHCHIGSQIFDPEPFALAVERLMGFMAQARDELGLKLTELNLGGGFGIQYLPSHDPRPLDEVVKAAAAAVKACCARLGLELPRLVLEPGRSIVGPAGVTVYTVGSVKRIPEVRTYVSVDGGMADNIRFALYGAQYSVLLPERADAAPTQTVTVAGRFCESGDILAQDVPLPDVKPGDLLAVLATGAYNYSMASHYNRVPKPPIVTVSGGTSRIAVRRETYEDLVRQDV